APREETMRISSLSKTLRIRTFAAALLLFGGTACPSRAQSPHNSPDSSESAASMQQRISTLETEVAELKAAVHQLQAIAPTPAQQPRVLLASTAPPPAIPQL